MPISSVIVVTGALGSGKTSVLAHLAGCLGGDGSLVPARSAGLLASAMSDAPVQQGSPVAVVNELGALNPDAQRLYDVGLPVLELSGGAIETTLRARFSSVLGRLASRTGRTRVLVEASGTATPSELLWAVGEALGPDTPTAVVTVVDSTTFLDDRLHTEAPVTGGARPLAEVLRGQVEQADAVVLNKTDLAAASDVEETARVVSAMNPAAPLVRATRGRFDAGVVRPRAPERTLTAGVAAAMRSMAFCARRPLHPGRTRDLLSGGSIAAARSKGLCWLAAQDAHAWWWSQCAALTEVTPGPAWWAATEPSRWPSDERAWARIYATWAAPYGDRRQELVLTGVGLDAEYHRLVLGQCLLTDQELAVGVGGPSDPRAAAALGSVRSAA